MSIDFIKPPDGKIPILIVYPYFYATHCCHCSHSNPCYHSISPRTINGEQFIVLYLCNLHNLVFIGDYGDTLPIVGVNYSLIRVPDLPPFNTIK